LSVLLTCKVWFASWEIISKGSCIPTRALQDISAQGWEPEGADFVQSPCGDA
jgi:hypothetical protein